MNDFFQENKRFLMTYAIGALVFLVAWLIIGSLYNSDIKRNRSVKSRAMAAAKKRLPAGVRIGDLKQARLKQDRSFKTLAGAVGRNAKPEFTLEGVSDPDLHYNEVIDRIRSEVLEECILQDIEVDDDLGTPSKFPSTRPQFEWYLRGLDAVEHVLKLVLKTDRNVLEGGIARVTQIEIGPPSKNTSKRKALKPFVSHHPVRFSIAGHPRAVAYILEELSRSDKDGMLLVRSASIHSLDLPPGQIKRSRRGMDPGDVRRVQLSLEVAALDINKDGRIRKRGVIK